MALKGLQSLEFTNGRSIQFLSLLGFVVLPHVLLVFFIGLTTPFMHIHKPIPVFILATDTTKDTSQKPISPFR
jgi:hypothetical protein